MKKNVDSLKEDLLVSMAIHNYRGKINFFSITNQIVDYKTLIHKSSFLIAPWDA